MLVIIYLFKVVGVILILVIGFWIIGKIIDVFKWSMEKWGFDLIICFFLILFVSVGLKVFLFFSVVSMFGIEIIFFVVLFGVLVFVVGMVL